MLGEGVGGADPGALDRLAAVVQRLLAVGRVGDEEARVEAAGRADRGDPVADVAEVVELECETLVEAHLREAEFAAVHLAAQRGEPRCRRRIVERDVIAAVAGQQHTRFLEALTDCSHPVGETAMIDVDPSRCRRIVEADADRLQSWVLPVFGIHGAAGEHELAGHELAARVAPQHEHLKPAVAVAHQHHGCRLPERDLDRRSNLWRNGVWRNRIWHSGSRHRHGRRGRYRGADEGVPVVSGR